MLSMTLGQLMLDILLSGIYELNFLSYHEHIALKSALHKILHLDI